MVTGRLMSRVGFDRLEAETQVLRLMKGDESLGMILLQVPFVSLRRFPSLDEGQPVRVIGAGEEVVGDATRLGPGRGLHFRSAGENLGPPSRSQLKGDDELVHPSAPLPA